MNLDYESQFITLRLAILQQSYGRFGGAERLAFSHYGQLKKMNKDVTLFYEGRISPGWKNRLQDEPIRSIPSGVANHASDLRNLLAFLHKLNDFDRIIIHHHVEPILAFYLSKLLGPKIIWYSGSVFELPWEKTITQVDYRSISTTVKRTSSEFYGSLFSKLLLSDPLYGLTVQLARFVDIKTVRGFGKIVGNSVFLSNFLARVYGLKKVPPVAYPGPDPLLEKLSSAPPVKEQDYMLAVGTLIPLKNIEGLILSAVNVRSSKVVLVGEGQERGKLEELAEKVHVPIEFRGAFDEEADLARAYSECKFLVHLSLYEPFGLTPVEAALFSKPSIVTNLGGPPEVVMEGVTGYIVNPRDHRYIGAKMNALLLDDPLRREMGQRAKENIERNFTLEKSTTRLLEEVES